MAETPKSMYWQKKGIKRVLTLQFEEGDDILKGIESAMRENGIHEVNIVEATGSIRSGLGNYLNGSQFLTKNFDNSKIKIAAGHFEIKGSIFGVLKIIPAALDAHVTVAKAKAVDGMEMKLSYYTYEDSP